MVMLCEGTNRYSFFYTRCLVVPAILVTTFIYTSQATLLYKVCPKFDMRLPFELVITISKIILSLSTTITVSPFYGRT